MSEPLPPFTIAEAAARRFWAKVERRGPDDCWEFTGERRKGYGMILWGGRMARAHRVSLELAGRPLLPGQITRHSCDNPPCVNPAHLFAGDNGANMRDMWAKGRGNRSPEYRLSLSRGVRAAWARTSPEKRRLWGARISATLLSIARCGAPLAQSSGGCFCSLGHTGAHRSEAGIIRRRQRVRA